MNNYLRELAHHLTWFPRSLFWRFIEGDHIWGQLRFLVALALIASFAIMGRLTWETINMKEQVEWLITLQPFGAIVAQVPKPVSEFILSLFTLQAIRYWVPPLCGAVLAFLAGALYFQDIFNLEKLRDEAGRYLFYSLFSLLKYPTLVIRDGKAETSQTESNKNDSRLIEIIGGPGNVDIKLGNAVLFERGAGASSVHGAGKHFIRRFERIREIVSLEGQHRSGEATADTNDGIPVTVRGIETTFRIRAHHREKPSHSNPYPFSPSAIRTVSYNHAVNDKGTWGDWQSRVLGAVKSKITNWIAANTLDTLTAPLNEDPRKQIHELFLQPKVRQQFADMGVELSWVSVGHIDTPKEVDMQRLTTWQAIWQKQDLVTQAHAEAIQITYKSLARAEAQSETLMAIMQSLRDAAANAAPGAQARLSDLIIIYMAQIIESMTAAQPLAEKQNPLQLKSNSSPTHDTGK